MASRLTVKARKFDIHKDKTACLVVALFEEHILSPSALLLNQILPGGLLSRTSHWAFEGKNGQSLVLHGIEGSNIGSVLLLGAGKADEFAPATYQKLVQTAIKQLATQVSDAVLMLDELTVTVPASKDPLLDDVTPFGSIEQSSAWKAREAGRAIGESLYRFDGYKSSGKAPKLASVQYGLSETPDSDISDALALGQAIATGTACTRDVANTPPNICHPSWMASQAQALGKQHKSLSVQVIDEKALDKMGMGAFMAVSRGSSQSGKLVIMEHKPARALNHKPFVFVGKGITFDTGGISLKPGANMDEMKFDMCGAASVLGLMTAVCAMKLDLHVIGVMICAENMPSGEASRPGDIVKTLSGQTVEILNTDAEGRLVLCDALTYVERFEPALVVDIATLTGACVVALGKVPSGLFSNSERLAHYLLEAGDSCGDRAWQLPAWSDYQELLDSPFADMANIGGPYGGAITAACFLSRFTKNYPWAHLDIAGTAWHSGSNKGATGRPVPLLAQFLLDQRERLLLRGEGSKSNTSKARRPASKKTASSKTAKAKTGTRRKSGSRNA